MKSWVRLYSANLPSCQPARLPGRPYSIHSGTKTGGINTVWSLAVQRMYEKKTSVLWWGACIETEALAPVVGGGGGWYYGNWCWCWGQMSQFYILEIDYLIVDSDLVSLVGGLSLYPPRLTADTAKLNSKVLFILLWSLCLI